MCNAPPVAIGALQVDEIGVEDGAKLGVPAGVFLHQLLGRRDQLVVEPSAAVAWRHARAKVPSEAWRMQGCVDKREWARPTG